MTKLWLQNLPEKWKAVRLKTVVELKTLRANGSSTKENYIGLENIEPWTGRLLKSAMSENTSNDEDEKESVVSWFKPGNILFGKLRPYLAKVHLAQEYGICTTELLVLNPSEVLFGRFVIYVLLTPEFINLVNAETFGARMPRADWNTIGDLLIPLPSLAEQIAIANYLDRETAKIDTLISAKERLLDLLTEKRRALMTHAVTYGLNHNSPRTDSEVKLFSNIPQHWKISRLRWFVKTLEQGWSPQAEEREISEEEWGVLKLNAVKEGQFDDSKAKALPESIDIPMNLEICPGDFLITRGNTPDLVGDVCYVSKTRPNLILSDLIYRLRLDELKLNGKFLNFFLQSHVGRLQIVSDARGSSASMVKISQEHILNWLIPIPPIDEQNQIVDYIKTNVLKLDNLSIAAKRTIEILQERRTALITAAVTGQVKVTA